jgi:predicted amidohydrolase YtcJ
MLLWALLFASADLLVTNARVWTGDPARPWASSIAVSGGRIVALDQALPATRTIDAGGRLVVPGFNDAHVHFLGGSLRLSQVDLTGICTLPTIQQAVSKWARENPNEPWITGGGWEYGCFPGGRLPTKEDLDAVIKDRPVYLSAYDGHTSWANSKALALAGIGRDTKFDGFGEVVKDPKTGEPSGAFKESAGRLVARLLPPPTTEQKMAAVSRGMKLAASLGITSLQNASGSRDEIELWQQVPRTLRVSLAMSVGRGDCQSIADLRGKYSSPLFKVSAVKFMLDGVIESHTAAMLDNYSDGSNTRGDLGLPEDAYKKAVANCAAQGWQIYTHAIGDRAVRVALDAYQAGVPRDARPRVEHIENARPADIARFGKLGVLASMMPIHTDPGTVDVWSKAVGPERLPDSFPWRALQTSGARLVFSSDWPASISLSPIRGIHNAVNRPWVHPQHVDVETALRGYTSEAAYSSFEENLKGTLKEGQLADFVVLSQNLFEIAPQDIEKTKVEVTVFNGQVVYQRPQRVLFIGNSLTYYNDLPKIYAGFGPNIETRSVTRGGATLQLLWDLGEARAAIREGNWDYVVLQEQSLLGEGLADGQMAVNDPAMFRRAATLFDNEIRRAGARTVLYMHWARKAYPQHQPYIAAAYNDVARELGAIVSPAGIAWQRIGSVVDLYDPDGLHPALPGSQVAAAVLYSVLNGKPAPVSSELIQKVALGVAEEQRAAGGYLPIALPEKHLLSSGRRPAPAELSGTWTGTLQYFVYPQPAEIDLTLKVDGDKCIGQWTAAVPSARLSMSVPVEFCAVTDTGVSFAVRVLGAPASLDRYEARFLGDHLVGSVHRTQTTQKMTGSYDLQRR